MKLAEQPVRILVYLVERPGEIVTREELRDLLWGQETFVDFEHGLNAAINKLREVLGDSASNPRFIETVPRRGYRFIAEVGRVIPKSSQSVAEARSDPAPKEPLEVEPSAAIARKHYRWAVPMLFLVIGGAGGWWWSSRSRPREFVTRPLTSGNGLTTSPAISPDGRLVAYASDRATQKNLDIWVQPLARGGEPIRLTRHEADDYDPSFSPDGGLVAFKSNRDGGGIYVVPALGGQERLIVRGGRWPRFSPDGNSIAFTLSVQVNLSESKIYLVPVTGGAPRRIAPDLQWASRPVFSPDGRHILFVGAPSSNASLSKDWWIAPVEGGASTRTDLVPALKQQGLELDRSSDPGGPKQWIGNRILFVAGGHVWEVEISDGTWKTAGPARQLTGGASDESEPDAAVVDGRTRMVFSTASSTPHLWRLRLDPNKGKPLGEPEALPHTGGEQVEPSVSADGTRLVYRQHEAGAQSVRVRDLSTGIERTLLSKGIRARLSPDGSMVACSDMKELSVIPASGGDATPLIAFSGRGNVLGWSPDGKKIVYWDNTPIRYSLLDPQSRKATVLISHPKYDIHDAVLSPDQHWVAFHTPMPRNTVVRIAPVHEGRAAEEGEWITVIDRVEARRPWWSPDGNLVYFLTNLDGFFCFYAQRLEPASKRAVGDPFPVHHVHHARGAAVLHSWFSVPAVLPDGIIFSMYENSGNVWMAEEK